MFNLYYPYKNKTQNVSVHYQTKKTIKTKTVLVTTKNIRENDVILKKNTLFHHAFNFKHDLFKQKSPDKSGLLSKKLIFKLLFFNHFN
jgi:hypothetical protein